MEQGERLKPRKLMRWTSKAVEKHAAAVADKAVSIDEAAGIAMGPAHEQMLHRQSNGGKVIFS